MFPFPTSFKLNVAWRQWLVVLSRNTQSSHFVPKQFSLIFPANTESVWALMHKPKHSRKAKEVILFCPMALINHYTLITVRFFYPQHCPLLRIPASFSHLPHWHNHFKGYAIMQIHYVQTKPLTSVPRHAPLAASAFLLMAIPPFQLFRPKSFTVLP